MIHLLNNEDLSEIYQPKKKKVAEKSFNQLGHQPECGKVDT